MRDPINRWGLEQYIYKPEKRAFPCLQEGSAWAKRQIRRAERRKGKAAIDPNEEHIPMPIVVGHGIRRVRTTR